jgi:hypothetical protein
MGRTAARFQKLDPAGHIMSLSFHRLRGELIR